jgi:hypothetical protein
MQALLFRIEIIISLIYKYIRKSQIGAANKRHLTLAQYKAREKD